MHTWAKRGLQTALFTGGLLMLGTGIASASENVNPDVRPSGVDQLLGGTTARSAATPGNDALVKVPYQVKNNSVSSPLRKVDLPCAENELKLGSGVPGAVNGVTEQVIGTKTVAELDVPVQAVNNQLGLGTPAVTSGDHTQTYEAPTPVTADGSGQNIRGNVVRVQDLVPVQLANNAIAVGSDAATDGAASQTVTGGGNIETSGKDGTLSGLIGDQRGAAPLGVGGNALALGGTSKSTSHNEQAVHNDGRDRTNGDNGKLAGHALVVPAALPVLLSDNAGVLGGTGEVPAGADPDCDTGVARCVPTPSTATGSDTSTVTSTATAKGNVITGGRNSTLSGWIGSLPVAFISKALANSIAVLGGTDVVHQSTVIADATSNTYTNGDDSTGSAQTVAAPMAGTLDLVGTAGTLLGDAETEADTMQDALAGGYNGTTGNDATLSGNLVQAPQAMPIELIGNALPFGGHTMASVSEDKVVSSGKTPNSDDDNGKFSSNVVQGANAVPVLVNGLVFGFAGDGEACTEVVSSTEAGKGPKANGDKGVFSGNIFGEQTSFPVVAQELAVGGLSTTKSTVDTVLDSKAGGPAVTSGEDGTVAGNIGMLPIGGQGNVAMGNNVSVLGTTQGVLDHEQTSVAGGDNETNGDRGTISGSIVDVPLVPKFVSTSHGFSFFGTADSEGHSIETIGAGGDDTTSGEGGRLSGDIAQVPGALAFAWIACIMNVFSDVQSSAEEGGPVHAGGDLDTSGDPGSLSGIGANPGAKLLTGITTDAIGMAPSIATGVNSFDGAPSGANNSSQPIGSPLVVNAPVEEFALPLGPGQPFIVDNTNDPGRWQDGIDVPLGIGEVTGLLGATDLPTLPTRAATSQRFDLDDLHAGKHRLGQIPGVGGLPVGALPGLPELPELPALGSLPLNAELGNVGAPSLDGLPGLSSL